MSRLSLTLAAVLVAACSVLPGVAQQSPAGSGLVVPAVTKFNGTLIDLNGKPITGTAGVTFGLYKEEHGGAALWMETQNVTPDKNGRYSVTLGASRAQGLPADLFASGEARWLGVQAEGQAESARTLLVSVPYAMKALDAETLGGVPASAFLRAAQGDGNRLQSVPQGQTKPTVHGSGTVNTLPLFTASSIIGNSVVTQSGGNVGIGTSAPVASLDVNGMVNSATGFSIGATPVVLVSSANGNTLLGSSGNPAAGLANTAVGSSTLAVNVSGSVNTAVGTGALLYNTSDNNTAVGVDALTGNTSGASNVAVGADAGFYNQTGSGNTFIGYFADSTSPNLTNATAIGAHAVVNTSNTMVLGQAGTEVTIGASQPAPGTMLTIQADDTGSAPKQLVIQGQTDPNRQLLVGYQTNVGLGGYGTIQAIDQGVKFTTLALNPNGGPVVVGTNYSSGNPFVIGSGLGGGLADGWVTYSSRRWKTNVQTLHGALDKVAKLRGVSYDLKSNGKHEVGVIAEEVGAVIPEIVQWEKNGKDAAGVDYSRLAALLIEAVKEQQRQALAKDRKIARLTTQVHQLHKLNGQLALLQSRMERLEQERATTLTATSRPMCNGARN